MTDPFSMMHVWERAEEVRHGFLGECFRRLVRDPILVAVRRECVFSVARFCLERVRSADAGKLGRLNSEIDAQTQLLVSDFQSGAFSSGSQKANGFSLYETAGIAGIAITGVEISGSPPSRSDGTQMGVTSVSGFSSQDEFDKGGTFGSFSAWDFLIPLGSH